VLHAVGRPGRDGLDPAAAFSDPADLPVTDQPIAEPIPEKVA
jgi:hypothetical protein